MSDQFHCLVVEDSPLMRQHLKMALQRIQGLVITEAEDGIDALKKMSTQKFDIVIADINMPVMDGLKLVKRIRSDAVHGKIPIVIVTTESVQDKSFKVSQLDVNDYFTKPINPSEVVQKVKQLLNIPS